MTPIWTAATAPLLAKQLVGELILLIHPFVLGSGQRLFDDGPSAVFELAHTRPTIRRPTEARRTLKRRLARPDSGN